MLGIVFVTIKRICDQKKKVTNCNGITSGRAIKIGP